MHNNYDFFVVVGVGHAGYSCPRHVRYQQRVQTHKVPFGVGQRYTGKICPHHHNMRAETRVQCSLESKMRPRGSELGVKWRVTHNYFNTCDLQ